MLRIPQSYDELVGQIRQLMVELFRRQGTVNAHTALEIELLKTRLAILEKREAVQRRDLELALHNIHSALQEADQSMPPEASA